MKVSIFVFLNPQTLQEPEGDGDAAHSTFGGHKVLAVMKPPTQRPQAQGTVSVSVMLSK